MPFRREKTKWHNPATIVRHHTKVAGLCHFVFSSFRGVRRHAERQKDEKTVPVVSIYLTFKVPNKKAEDSHKKSKIILSEKQ